MNRAKILSQAKTRRDKVQELIRNIKEQKLNKLLTELTELDGLINLLEPKHQGAIEAQRTEVPDYEQTLKQLPKQFGVSDIAAIVGDKQKAYQYVALFKRKQLIDTISPGNYQKVNG